MRKVGAVRVRLKAELNDAHAGELRVLQEFHNVFAEYAEVFRDNRHFAELVFHRVKQRFAGAFFPNAVFGGVAVGGNRPVRGKRAEVVDAHRVVKLQRGADAFAPPSVIVLFHCYPVVKRVSPKLAVLREIIGRHAGNALADKSAVVNFKQMPIFPNICAVKRNINRHIAEDFHAVFVGVLFDFAPLGERRVLYELEKVLRRF